MTDSNGNGETKEKKKAGPATTIAAITALLAAGGTFVKDVKGQHEQELLQESIFNYATAETSAIKERLARLETHVEWLRKSMEAEAAMVSRPECSTDDDCGEANECVEGKCVEPAEEAAVGGGGGGVGDVGGWVEHPAPEAMPEPAPPMARDKPAKFEDLKEFIQAEQRAWAD